MKVSFVYAVVWALAAVAALLVTHLEHLGVWAQLIAILSGLPAVIPVWVQLRKQVPELVTLRTVADQLAERVAREWEGEAALRRLFTASALEVSWEAADPDLAGRLPNLVRMARDSWPGDPRSDPRGWARRPADLSGSNKDLYDVLMRRVPTGRIVLLGERGSGKSTLLVRLMLDVLDKRRVGSDRDEVPVLVSLASWIPDRQDFRSWLTDTLCSTYPMLRLPASLETSENRAQALLREQMLILILDGLDEIRREHRRSAIEQIDESLQRWDKVVIACRLDAYEAAIRSRPSERDVAFRAAAGLMLQPLDSADVARYLREDAGGTSAARRWDPVISLLGTDAAVGEVLTTPLMVGLARTIFNPRRDEHAGQLPDPAVLCAAGQTVDSIQAYLFDGFITASYRPVPSHGRARWRTSDAQRWLGFLAADLYARQEVDLSWWHLRSRAPRWVIGSVVGSACGLTSGLAAGVGSHVGVGYGMGLGWGIALALAVGLPIRKRRIFSHKPLAGLAGGLLGGILGGLLAGIAGAYGMGRAPGLVGGTSAGLGVGIAAGPPSGILGGFTGCLCGGVVAGLLVGAGTGLPAGLINGLAVAAGAGLTTYYATWPTTPSPAQRPVWSAVGLGGGAAAALAIGLTTWKVANASAGLILGSAAGVVIGWVSGLGSKAQKLEDANDPITVLKQDRSAFTVLTLAAGTSTGLVTCLAVGLDVSIEKHRDVTALSLLTNGLGAGCAVGVACGLVLAFVQTAWGSFTITRYWLAARGRLPRRLVRFLSDAHQRHGILRQMGPNYQFRHLELRNRIGQTTPAPSDQALTRRIRTWLGGQLQDVKDLFTAP